MVELNIYWDFMCCDSLIPIDVVNPKTAGTGCCDSEDFDRFGEWAQIQKWRNWDGCPECDASEPLIYGRRFILQ